MLLDVKGQRMGEMNANFNEFQMSEKVRNFQVKLELIFLISQSYP